MRAITVVGRLGRRLAAIGAGPWLACAAMAGPADAGPDIRLTPPAAPLSPGLDLRRSASPYDAAQALKAAGVARTAIDHSFRGGDATASAGLLCGLQPNTQTSGAAGALGVDRDGRFLGARLRLGFR